jgi:hypothetical protein
LNEDYIPRTDTSKKGVSPIIDIKTDSSSIKQENKQQQLPGNNKFIPQGNKGQLNQQPPANQQNNSGTIKQDSTGIQNKQINSKGNKNK